MQLLKLIKGYLAIKTTGITDYYLTEGQKNLEEMMIPLYPHLTFPEAWGRSFHYGGLNCSTAKYTTGMAKSI